MRDPGEKGKNFKAGTFVIKGFLSFICVHTLVKKMNLKILHMDVFEAFGRYESHFQTD